MKAWRKASTWPPVRASVFTASKAARCGKEGGKVRKAAVPIACGNGPVLEQYWEDGPQFTGWGTAVCTYPDGNPAIVEGASGKGWVV